jgi:hypothetical protein
MELKVSSLTEVDEAQQYILLAFLDKTAEKRAVTITIYPKGEPKEPEKVS